MEKGTVVSWSKQNGYGFIEPDNGDEDVFAHESEIIARPAERVLYPTQRVQFEAHPQPGKKNRRATAIKALD